MPRVSPPSAPEVEELVVGTAPAAGAHQPAQPAVRAERGALRRAGRTRAWGVAGPTALLAVLAAVVPPPSPAPVQAAAAGPPAAQAAGVLAGAADPPGGLALLHDAPPARDGALRDAADQVASVLATCSAGKVHLHWSVDPAEVSAAGALTAAADEAGSPAAVAATARCTGEEGSDGFVWSVARDAVPGGFAGWRARLARWPGARSTTAAERQLVVLPACPLPLADHAPARRDCVATVVSAGGSLLLAVAAVGSADEPQSSPGPARDTEDEHVAVALAGLLADQAGGLQVVPDAAYQQAALSFTPTAVHQDPGPTPPPTAARAADVLGALLALTTCSEPGGRAQLVGPAVAGALPRAGLPPGAGAATGAAGCDAPEGLRAPGVAGWASPLEAVPGGARGWAARLRAADGAQPIDGSPAGALGATEAACRLPVDDLAPSRRGCAWAVLTRGRGSAAVAVLPAAPDPSLDGTRGAGLDRLAGLLADVR